MLPVITYGLKQPLRDRMLGLLEQQGPQYRVSTQLVSSSDVRDTLDAIEETDGIGLYLLGVSSFSQGHRPEALMLGRTAMQRNRFNYTVYLLQDKADLERVVALCQRPYCILTAPVNWALAAQAFSSLLEDYARLCQPDDSGNYLVIQSNGVRNRIDIRAICYIEARDKKLIIYLENQVLSVYDSISILESKLGDRFFRCHRSFLVNKDFIQSVHLSALELTLRTGERLPIARSNRAKAREIFGAKEADVP